MTRQYWLAGVAIAACASLAACAPYPAGYGGPGYAGAYVPGPYAYGPGAVYAQPAPYETFGFGGGFVDPGWRGRDDWHGDRDNGWRGGDRGHDQGGGQRFGGEGFHPTPRQGGAPPAPRFNGGGSGFRPIAPAAAPRAAPAPQGGGKPMQWWKGS